MPTQIKCPHCNETFEPSQAFKHELEKKLVRDLENKHKEALDKLEKEKQELAASKDRELEATKKEIYHKAQAELEDKNRKELKDKQEQIETLKKRAEQAEQEELKARKQKRELEEAKRKFELEKQRQLDEERDKIRDNALKEAQDKHELKDKEREAVIENLKKSLAEAQRKASQGSQQTQGEVLEVEIEAVLNKHFPQDTIEEVKKGQRGADIIQHVFDTRGQPAGTILWESKNGKWQPAWIKKLKEDQCQAKADLTILVSNHLPEDITDFDYKEGVWILSRKMIVPIASTLRFDLIRVNHERGLNTNANEKMAVLYQYMTSTEFKHRLEAIAESFNELQDHIEKEKRFFQTKWARQEKSLRKMIDHTHGMYGEIQSIAGKSLPEIKSLKLEAGGK